MNKAFIFLGIVLVALFLVACTTQKTADTTGTNGASETTPLDSDLNNLNTDTDTNSVDSGLSELNSDLDTL